jgi:hypothetical protein
MTLYTDDKRSAKHRLFDAVHAGYEQRYRAPILATGNEEIFTLCEKVVGTAETDDAERVIQKVLTAIWMSPREASARLKAR